MKKNLRNTDRFLRWLTGSSLILLFFTGILSGRWSNPALGLGILLVLTALIRCCPLYLPFQINTSHKV